MQAESFAEMADQGSKGRYKADQNLYVKFVMHPHRDPALSEQEGRPIFKEIPYIQITVPGNKESMIFRPASKMDIDRFPEHYRKFQARVDQEVMEGTPLSEWPAVTRSQVEELKFFNIHTVEQLVSAPDSAVQGMMGINMLKDKAKAYLEAAGNQKAAEELKSALDRIAQLEAKLSQPAEEDGEEAPKRRGRPPKTE